MTKLKKYLGFIVISLAIICIALINIKYVFPITDGWWETYAWIFNKTGELYEQSALKFPPLFVLIIDFLSNSLNLTHYESRILFVIVRLVTFVITFLWLKKYFGIVPAFLGAAIPVFLINANPVYLAKDYHTISALIISFIFFLIAYGFDDKRKPCLSVLFLVGVSCSLLLLNKHNIGLFLSIGIFVYYIIAALSLGPKSAKNIFLDFIIGLTGFLIPLFVVSFIVPDWHSVFFGNDSKGSVITVLFRFILDKVILLQLVASLLVLFLCWMTLTKKRPVFINELFPKFDLVVYSLGPIFLIVLSMFTVLPLNIVSLAWPLFFYIHTKNSQNNNSPENKIWILLYSYAYCGTNTAGFNFVTIDYLIAFYIASSYYLFQRSNFGQYINKIYSWMLLSGLMITYVMVVKIFSGAGYNWWGLKSGGLIESTVELKHPELRGLFTDPSTAAMIDIVLKNASEMNSDESIFAYPSIPILYKLSNKLPIGSPVLWFDVSGRNEALHTLNEVIKTKPKYIYWLRPPEIVYHGHFNLRKKDPGMVVMDEWLINAVKSDLYKVVRVIPSYDINHTYLTKKFNQKIEPVLNLSSSHIQLLASYCDSDPGCRVIDGSYSFNRGLGYNAFMQKSMTLWSSPDHIFYVLERSVDLK